MIMTKEEIQGIFTEWTMKLKNAGYPVAFNLSPELDWTKSTRNWGVCDVKGLRSGNPHYTISLTEHMTHISRRAVENTVIHELLHTIDGCMNHGPLWKSYAGHVEHDFGYHIMRVNGDKSPEDVSYLRGLRAAKSKGHFIYIIKCPECGTEWRYDRLAPVVKDPSHYSCRRCHRKLEADNYEPAFARDGAYRRRAANR